MPDKTFVETGQLDRLKARVQSRHSGPPHPIRSQLPDLGVIFFSGSNTDDDPYELLLDVSRFVDAAGFSAVWTPERHFTGDGGAYPNPSVLGAALAMVTDTVRIRAGSINLPLHDPLRVAEEWALVDNLSGGRVDLALAPGWHAKDFVLSPAHFDDRAAVLDRARLQLQRLWRGETVERSGPNGTTHEIGTYPRPRQQELPLWLTSSKSVESWRFAGEAGLNVLSALINFGPAELEKRITVYRQAREHVGLDPATGVVSLMLHTYVGDDDDGAVNRVKPVLTEYLSGFVSQHSSSGQKEADGKSETLQNLGDDRDDFLDMVFHRYTSTSSLIGSVARVERALEGFASMGVDEVACLVDFGLTKDEILKSLALLSSLIVKENIR